MASWTVLGQLPPRETAASWTQGQRSDEMGSLELSEITLMERTTLGPAGPFLEALVLY